MNKFRKQKRAFQIAHHHYYKWNYNKAVKSFLRWLGRKSFWMALHDTYLLRLADSFVELWNYAKALQTLNLCLIYSPSNVDAKTLKCSVLKRMGRFKEALSIQNEIARLALSNKTQEKRFSDFLTRN